MNQNYTEITIISLNDLHAEISLLPKLATLIYELRKQKENLLILASGDMLYGMTHHIKGSSANAVIEILNHLKINAISLGNHEFEEGIEKLNTYAKNSNFDYVCTNICSNALSNIKKHLIYTLAGYRIYIGGVIQIGNNGCPDGNPSMYEGATFQKYNEIIDDIVSVASVCDLSIMLTHQGVEEDEKLAEAIPTIDVIIGGHSHTIVKDNYISNGVLITQAGGWGKNCTKITLILRGNGIVEKQSKNINISNYKKDPEIARMVKVFEISLVSKIWRYLWSRIKSHFIIR